MTDATRGPIRILPRLSEYVPTVIAKAHDMAQCEGRAVEFEANGVAFCIEPTDRVSAHILRWEAVLYLENEQAVKNG